MLIRFGLISLAGVWLLSIPVQAHYVFQNPEIDRQRRESENQVFRDADVNQRIKDQLSTMIYESGQRNLSAQNAYERTMAIKLANLGYHYSDIGERVRALDAFRKAIKHYHAIHDWRSEKALLIKSGSEWHELGDDVQSAKCYEQALAIPKIMKDLVDEGETLINIGRSFSSGGQYDTALKYNERALSLFREVRAEILKEQGNKTKKWQASSLALISFTGEAVALNEIGSLYLSFGRLDKAQEYCEQALDICTKIDPIGTKSLIAASIYNNLGILNKLLDRTDESLRYYNESLAIFRKHHESFNESTTLNNIGNIHNLLGHKEEAINCYEQSLAISRKLNFKINEARILNNLGILYSSIGLKNKSLVSHQQALILVGSTRNQMLEAFTLCNLMAINKDLDRPQLAIFYGKQAINIFQGFRAQLQSFDQETQQEFLKSKEQTYRTLADLLISLGRLPEAQQVIRLLKEEEFFDFIRRDDKSSNDSRGRANLTPQELEMQKKYREISGRIISIGTEIAVLNTKAKLTSVEEKRLTELEAQRAIANEYYYKVLDGFAEELAGKLQAAKVEEIRQSQNLDQALGELGEGTVAIYTLLTEKRYLILLVTPNSRKAVEQPIGAAELNRKILQFREVLENPRLDPRPQARELYQILIAPIESDLVAAQAKTLTWSLDGVLRYLPVAALYDGEKYLVERYDNVVITLASLLNLKDQTQPQWKGLGLGVSKAQSGFSPLPAVTAELRALIHDENSKDFDSGILPGRVLLDEQFTASALRRELRQHFPLVHIASHFQFRPGNEKDSFLLLGDGSQLTLAQLRMETSLFKGVDLLSLSACNTATGGIGAEGKEIESFGILAQHQGAKAVLATLWPVADASTQLLMQKLYQLRQTQVGMSKAQVLREAQLSLLHGTIQSSAPAASRGVKSANEKNVTDLFTADPKAPYAHPYYWAPFILIGNWK